MCLVLDVAERTIIYCDMEKTGEEADTVYFKILTWHSGGTRELSDDSQYNGWNLQIVYLLYICQTCYHSSCPLLNESATIFQHIKLIPHSSAASACYRWMEDFCTHKARWWLHAMNLEHTALECHPNRTKDHFTQDCHIWVWSHILQQIAHYEGDQESSHPRLTGKLHPPSPLCTKALLIG
jgi:hypothetical protein